MSGSRAGAGVGAAARTGAGARVGAGAGARAGAGIFYPVRGRKLAAIICKGLVLLGGVGHEQGRGRRGRREKRRSYTVVGG